MSKMKQVSYSELKKMVSEFKERTSVHNESFGGRLCHYIKDKMDDRSISVKELSKQTGVSEKTIRKILESHPTGSFGLLWKILLHLEVVDFDIPEFIKHKSLSRLNTDLVLRLVQDSEFLLFAFKFLHRFPDLFIKP